ncbi:hypothetical protein KC331_g65 [Hortaea werneckii]|nr:hypothetical protein KC331_g65 [Hortaea werneckii]
MILRLLLGLFNASFRKEVIVTTTLHDGAPNSITSTPFRMFIVYNSFDCDLFRRGYFSRISVQIVGVFQLPPNFWSLKQVARSIARNTIVDVVEVEDSCAFRASKLLKVNCSFACASPFQNDCLLQVLGLRLVVAHCQVLLLWTGSENAGLRLTTVSSRYADQGRHRKTSGRAPNIGL